MQFINSLVWSTCGLENFQWRLQAAVSIEFRPSSR